MVDAGSEWSLAEGSDRGGGNACGSLTTDVVKLENSPKAPGGGLMFSDGLTET